jgi:hypothetical protein
MAARRGAAPFHSIRRRTCRTRRATWLASCLLLLAAPATAAISNSFSLGADYSSQRFGVYTEDTLNYEIENDTLTTETEARGTWGFSLDLGSEPTSFSAANRLSLSTRSVHEGLDLNLRTDLAPWLELTAANYADVRVYHRLLPSLADTAFRRDYIDNSSRLELTLKPSDATSLSLTGRGYLGWYPEPDSYSYSYFTGRAGLDLRHDLDLLSSLDAGLELARRWTVPDQRYTEVAATAGIDAYLGTGPHAALTLEAARRTYADPGRCYLEAGPTFEFDADLSDAFSFGFDDDARATWYDSAAGVYTNFLENSTRVEFEYRAGADVGLRIGPQYDFGQELGARGDEDYRELSLFAGIDFARTDRFWLALDDRIGVRRFPNADTLLASNYLFNELNLVLDWTIVRTAGARLSLNGSASISPEWHAVDTDNFLTRIFSVELRYGP